MAHWVLEDDAPTRDRQHLSLATAISAAAAHLPPGRRPLRAMLDTVHAIRHAVSAPEVLHSHGPFASRAVVTLVDYSGSVQRLEPWDITPNAAR